jgi:uncharacterized protein involved in high-affinity Fe2+ transport
MSAPTGNFRGQRTQSSTGGYKTLASSIASGNNGDAFKRIYANAYLRFNGNSDLALSSTLGIQKGDYAPTNTNNYSFSTVKSASGPQVGNYKNKALISTPSSATSLSAVHTTSMMGATNCSSNSCLCIGCPPGKKCVRYNTNVDAYVCVNSN